MCREQFRVSRWCKRGFASLNSFFQSLEKKTRVFPIVGNFSGAGFPIIGKIPNHWKTAFAGLMTAFSVVCSAQAVEYNYVGWASGGVDAQGGVLLATTNGVDWFRQGLGQIPAVDLGGVCSAGSNVWVVGAVSNGYGVIAYSADDGASWVRQGDASSIPPLTLRKPWAVDENTIWVVGDNGLVMRTVNGGTIWSNVSLPTFTNMLQGVTAIDAQTAWVSGVADSNGFAGLFYTTDGGQNWTRAVQGAITNRDHVLGLYALDADLVWGLAGEETLIRSEDGGVNWVRVSGGTLKDGNELKVLDENHIWMAVDAQVQWTINGGYSWDGHNTAEYTMDVDTPWGTNVWAVASTYSGGIIYHSPDSGLTWTNQAESNAWIGLFMVDMQMRRGPPTMHYVDASSTNPVSPYTSWATAASNIQDAVDAAEEGDTVLVTNGVYRYGGGQFEAMPLSCARVALTNNLTVRSVNGPDVTFIEGAPGDYSDPDDIQYAYRCAAIDFWIGRGVDQRFYAAERAFVFCLGLYDGTGGFNGGRSGCSGGDAVKLCG